MSKQEIATQEQSVIPIGVSEGLNKRQRRFLNAYALTGWKTVAAERTGISLYTHYKWERESEAYRQALEQAEKIFGDWAEGDVRTRAFTGEPVEVSKVKPDGTIIKEKYNKKSDVLAMFALKAVKPQYRDNFQINQFLGPTQLAIRLDGAVQPVIADKSGK